MLHASTGFFFDVKGWPMSDDDDLAGYVDRPLRDERVNIYVYEQKMREIEEQLERLTSDVNEIGTGLAFSWIALAYLLANAWGWV